MSQVLAMTVFAFTMSISPGPVNVITFSNGINYGFRSSLPFVSGATLGFTSLLAMIGLGLASIMRAIPNLDLVLGTAGSLFLVYIGYKIAFSKASNLQSEQGTPSSFMEGAILQWLNPKAWAACMAGVSAFNVAQAWTDLLLFIVIYFLVCYLSIAAWALAGQQTQHLVKDIKFLKYLNFFMGASLIALASFLLWSQWHATMFD